jgi:hypothetical protein
MPDLVRLYIRHVAIGFALAAAFTGLLLWLDVAGLWHLVTHTADGLLAVALLVLFNGIVFAGVQFGIAVMRMEDRGDDDFRGRRSAMRGSARPLQAAAVAPSTTGQRRDRPDRGDVDFPRAWFNQVGTG